MRLIFFVEEELQAQTILVSIFPECGLAEADISTMHIVEELSIFHTNRILHFI